MEYEIIELQGKGQELGFQPVESWVLFEDTLFLVKDFTCLADLCQLISSHWNREREDDQILSWNTTTAYRQFLKGQGVKGISGMKKYELLNIIVELFKNKIKS